MFSYKFIFINWSRSNDNNHSLRVQQSHNTLVIERSKSLKNSTLHDQKKEIDVTKMERIFFHSSGVQRSPDHVPKVQLFRYVFLIILKHR